MVSLFFVLDRKSLKVNCYNAEAFNKQMFNQKAGFSAKDKQLTGGEMDCLDFEKEDMAKAKWMLVTEDTFYPFETRNDAEEYAAWELDDTDDIYLMEIKRPMYVNKKRKIDFTEL